MTTDYGYAKEKVYEALNALVGSSPLRRRLSDATHFLSLLHHPQQIPPEIADELRDVRQALDRLPQREIDRALLARRILSMFVKLTGGL
jgi:hypothetical protein